MTPSLVPLPAAEATPVEPLRMDAFQSAIGAAANALQGPAEVGESVLGALHGFQLRAGGMQALVREAAAPQAAPAASTAAQPALPATMLEQAQAAHRRMLGVMLQTYDFAIEASIVSRAATTFTSSVNTLIKTQ